MNAWFARVLGGAACTVGALAIGAGVAHADDTHHTIDVGAVVKVALHGDHGSTTKASSTKPDSTKSDSTKSGSTAKTATTKVRAAVTTGHLTRTRVTVSVHPRRSATATVRVAVPRAAKATARVELSHSRPTRAEETTHTKAATRTKSPVSTKAATHRPAVRADTKATPVRPLLGTTPRAVVEAHAKVAGVPVSACVLLNADGCAEATNVHRGSVVPPVVTTVDGSAFAVPVSACVLVNAAGCGTSSSTTTGPSKPALPAVIGDAGVTVQRLAAADVCARVNAGGCGSTTSDAGTGGGTTTPGEGTTDPGPVSTVGGGSVSISGGADSGSRVRGVSAKNELRLSGATAGLITADRFGAGDGFAAGAGGLAQTGSSPSLPLVLLAGFALVIAGGRALRKRVRAHH